LLFEFVPGVSFLRAAHRAWILGLLGLGLFAGQGISTLSRRLATSNRSRVTAAITAVGVVGLLLEGYTSWNDRPTITVSAVDRELARRPAHGGVLYLPAYLPGGLAAAVTTFGQVENVYGTTAHHRLTPNGYSGIFPSEWPAFSRRMLELPSPATLRELRSIDVHFVVVRSWANATPWMRFLDPSQAGSLHYIGRFGDDLLYELPGRR
jgi:hypothetical protein